MTKKQLARAAAFALVVVLLLLMLCDLFKLSNNPSYDKYFYTYRKLPESSIDAVLVGTSGMDRYFNAPRAYEEYGISAWNLSVDKMAPWLYINVIEDAQVYQDPQLFILDIRAFVQDNSVEEMDVGGRRVLNAINFFSVNYVKTALDIMEAIHEVDSSRSRWDFSYLLPFIKFHTKWEENGIHVIRDLGDRKHRYGSFHLERNRTVLKNPMETLPHDENLIIDLDPYMEDALYELIAYIREKKLNVLFLDTPKIRSEKEMGRMNRVYEILEAEGMPYLHYYTGDSETGFSIGLDPACDFYDQGHVNYYGAEKFMDAFGPWLNENYDLPDRRGDANARKVWNGVLDKVKARIEKYEADHAADPDRVAKILNNEILLDEEEE